MHSTLGGSRSRSGFRRAARRLTAFFSSSQESQKGPRCPRCGRRSAICDRLADHACDQGSSPRFEHRLFLSATPHNGHSNSFTALLELLDPQRFCRRQRVVKRNLDDVMIRRLKDDLREIIGGFSEAACCAGRYFWPAITITGTSPRRPARSIPRPPRERVKD